jgi:putative pyridoxal-dependent aspartate 1-decarboxylase
VRKGGIVPEGGFEERVMGHFTDLSSRDPEQQAISHLVSGMLEEFLARNDVTSPFTAEALSERFRDPAIPESPWTTSAYLALIRTDVLPHFINVASPRCVGHMSGAPPGFARPMSELVVALNQNTVKIEASKAIALIERQTLAMFHRLVYGLPDRFYSDHIQRNGSTLGIMGSGGTLANITALWCARNACFAPRKGFRGVEEEGMLAGLRACGFEGAVILGSRLMHYSIEKAASVLGIGVDHTIKIDVDLRGRMVVGALRNAIEDCRRRRMAIVAVVGVAGTTDCGTIDPLEDIGRIAAEEKIHFHVDAAWGGPLLFSEQHREKLKGIERASSVVIDAHKQLHLPIGLSTLLFRNPMAAKVLEKRAHYMLRDDSDDLGKFSIEGSRPGIALLVHAALHLIARDGYGWLVDEKIRKASEMAKIIKESEEFELLREPETSIVLYRRVPPQWRSAAAVGHLTLEDNERLNTINEAIQRAQYDAGRSYVSRTRLTDLPRYRGIPIVALRAVIGNPRTTINDLKAVLADQVECSRPWEATVAHVV